jgi:hypothetical protein
VFYRRLDDDRYTSADLTGTYDGYPIFIIAGNPIIKTLPLGELEVSRLPTLALNNVPYSYPNPTMWLTADRPVCFGGHFYARPDIIKFALMQYREEEVRTTGKPLKQHPMMFLYNVSTSFDLGQFFSNVPAFGWWKSVFPISLQLCWRLGARRVYLVGSSFRTRRANPYAWNVKLTRQQTVYSQMTYDEDLVRLKKLQPLFKESGFEVISCTPDSKVNEFMPVMKLEDAIKEELARMPTAAPFSSLRHSSETKQ